MEIYELLLCVRLFEALECTDLYGMLFGTLEPTGAASLLVVRLKWPHAQKADENTFVHGNPEQAYTDVSFWFETAEAY